MVGGLIQRGQDLETHVRAHSGLLEDFLEGVGKNVVRAGGRNNDASGFHESQSFRIEAEVGLFRAGNFFSRVGEGGGVHHHPVELPLLPTQASESLKHVVFDEFATLLHAIDLGIFPGTFKGAIRGIDAEHVCGARFRGPDGECPLTAKEIEHPCPLRGSREEGSCFTLVVKESRLLTLQEIHLELSLTFPDEPDRGSAACKNAFPAREAFRVAERGVVPLNDEFRMEKLLQG